MATTAAALTGGKRQDAACDLGAVSAALTAHADTYAGDVRGAAALLAESAPLLAELKRANREAYTELGAQREAIAHDRAALAAVETERQCLAYEAEQLRAHIDAVNALETVYEQVELCDMAEFERDVPDMPTDDAHELLLRRLQHELDVRRRLEQRVKALDGDAKAAAEKHAAAHSELGALERALAALCSSADKAVSSYQRTGMP